MIDYEGLDQVVSSGQPILLDDGLLEIIVEGPNPAGDGLVAIVQNSGVLGERKGVNIPGAKLDLPAMTDLDREHLQIACDLDADFVAASFVRYGSDVRAIRAWLGDCHDAAGRPDHHPQPKIISKIESSEAMENFEDILAESDGIMVARGDLGVEIPFSLVTRAQKEIVARCNAVGKPVIVATQMLESMVENPRPTRAEVSDVVNAVYDGADCVMLSGESAKGKWPVESVETLRRVATQADHSYGQFGLYHVNRTNSDETHENEYVAKAVCQAAADMSASLIIVLTHTGKLARLFSKQRGPVPVMAFVDDAKVGRQLMLERGLHPVFQELQRDVSQDRPKQAVRKARELGFVKPGDTVTIVLSEPASSVLSRTITTRVAFVE